MVEFFPNMTVIMDLMTELGMHDAEAGRVAGERQPGPRSGLQLVPPSPRASGQESLKIPGRGDPHPNRPAG